MAYMFFMRHTLCDKQIEQMIRNESNEIILNLYHKINVCYLFFEGLQKYTGNTITYAKGADVVIGKTAFVTEVKINTSDTSGFSEAVSAAKGADVVVMVLGEHGFQSGEGRSRVDINLPGVQQELLEAVHAENKNIVLVVTNGRPLDLTWADENIPAIVEAWHLGTQSGNAIAQVLYGDYNPSGKLPMTFPRDVGQVPIYYNYKNTGRPSYPGNDLVFWSHYTDEENSPLYPFGYGLSYTSFAYSNLKIINNFSKNKTVTVSVDIKNTGTTEGKEVAQLYLRDMYASATRPVKEFKGFDLISLKPSEEKTITFQLTDKELGFFDNSGNWLVETGEFEVYVGGSSDTTYKNTFKL